MNENINPLKCIVIDQNTRFNASILFLNILDSNVPVLIQTNTFIYESLFNWLKHSFAGNSLSLQFPYATFKHGSYWVAEYYSVEYWILFWRCYVSSKHFISFYLYKTDLFNRFISILFTSWVFCCVLDDLNPDWNPCRDLLWVFDKIVLDVGL